MIMFHSKYNNCLEDVLSTFLANFEIDHKFIYIYKWNFIYYPQIKLIKTSLGSRIDSGWNTNWDALKKIYGFSITTENNLSPQQFSEKLNKYGMLIMNADTYNIPWSKAFQKYHMQHFCLITGINQKHVVIEDPYLCSEPTIVSLDIIQKINYNIITIERKIENNLRCFELAHELVSGFEKINHNQMNSLDSIISFKNDFSKQYNYFDDYYNVGRGFSPLCIQIENIAFSRKNIATLVDAFYEKKEYRQIAAMFMKSFHLWEEIINIIKKHRENEELTKEAVEKVINNIIKTESAILKKLKDLLE